MSSAGLFLEAKKKNMIGQYLPEKEREQRNPEKELIFRSSMKKKTQRVYSLSFPGNVECLISISKAHRLYKHSSCKKTVRSEYASIERTIT